MVRVLLPVIALHSYVVQKKMQKYSKCNNLIVNNSTVTALKPQPPVEACYEVCIVPVATTLVGVHVTRIVKYTCRSSRLACSTTLHRWCCISCVAREFRLIAQIKSKNTCVSALSSVNSVLYNYNYKSIIKRTMRQYESRAITNDFTGSEIIT